MNPINTLRPATPEELIVNERIFGECNHTDWVERRDKYKNLNLDCTKCGLEFSYGNDEFEKPVVDQDTFLRSKIRKYSEEDVLSNVLLRKIKEAGWNTMVKKDNGLHVCTFENESGGFTSDPSQSRSAAICNAAAKLGTSGLFNIPMNFVSTQRR
jgi:hypothetical protein